jgi:hypothetical protein
MLAQLNLVNNNNIVSDKNLKHLIINSNLVQYTSSMIKSSKFERIISLSIVYTEGLMFFHETNFQILVDDNKCWHN